MAAPTLQGNHADFPNGRYGSTGYVRCFRMQSFGPRRQRCPDGDRRLPEGSGGQQHDDQPASSFSVDLPLGPAIARGQLWAAVDIQPLNPNDCRLSETVLWSATTREDATLAPISCGLGQAVGLVVH